MRPATDASCRLQAASNLAAWICRGAAQGKPIPSIKNSRRRRRDSLAAYVEREAIT